MTEEMRKLAEAEAERLTNNLEEKGHIFSEEEIASRYFLRGAEWRDQLARTAYSTLRARLERAVKTLSDIADSPAMYSDIYLRAMARKALAQLGEKGGQS